MISTLAMTYMYATVSILYSTFRSEVFGLLD